MPLNATSTAPPWYALQWLQWWLDQEMDGEEVLDVWDIGTAVITHMSKGYNRWCLAQSMKLINKTQKAAEQKAKKGGDAGADIEQLDAPEEGTRDQILQVWLDMLQKHSSTKATQLAVYLKRHAWGFSCSFGEHSKSSDQLNDMLRGLKQDEDSLRKTWVEEAVCQYAAKYTNTGESPTGEEQVRTFVPMPFFSRLFVLFLESHLVFFFGLFGLFSQLFFFYLNVFLCFKKVGHVVYFGLVHSALPAEQCQWHCV